MNQSWDYSNLQIKTAIKALNKAGFTKTNGKPVDVKFVTNFKMRNRRLTATPKTRKIVPVLKDKETNTDKSALFDLVLGSKINAEAKVRILKELVR